jgi:glycosyltransferase involved in cell wall biosynthesis
MQDGRIVLVRLWPKYDGKTHSLSGTLIRLDPANYKVICVYIEKCSDAENYFTTHGLDVVYLFDKKPGKVAILKKLYRLLKDEKADILHCHRHLATVYGALAAYMAGTPIVFSHVHGLNRTRGFVRRIQNALVMKMLNKVLTVSDSVRQDVIRTNPSIKPENVIALGNSIEDKRFINVDITRTEARQMIGVAPEQTFVFGTVGRLAPTKGQQYLIEAFARVKKVLPSCAMVFVGDGRSENELRELCCKLNCQDSVIFTGKRNDIPKVLRAFDCFVFPSIAEGLPCALLEAMASGLPSIATDVGGIPEVLCDASLGYVVPAQNVDKLADAMLSCGQMSQDQRSEIGRAASKRVQAVYSHDVIAKRLDELYTSELKAKSV